MLLLEHCIIFSMRYLLGFFIVVLGAAAVMKTEWLIQNFGTNAWAEAKLGYNGGSRLLYKLLGIGAILIGFMIITNLFGGFLQATVGRLLVPSA
jgi:hypothetical protein